MKILCKQHPDIMGLVTAFDKLGHDTVLWKDGPAFDIFDEVKPDIFITIDMNRAILKCIKERPNLHTMIYSKDNLCILDGKELELPNVVDNITFHHVDYNTHIASDITYIGKPNPMIMSLAYPIDKFNLKIFGPQPWPIPQYLGVVSTKEHCQAYSSTKIAFVTNVVEGMRAINCKAFCLTNKKVVAEELDIPLVEDGNIDNLRERVIYSLRHQNENQQWIEIHYPKIQKATYTILIKHILETVFK